MPKKGENIYRRKDGRWEGRFIKGYHADGKAKYSYVYGKTYYEAKQKLIDDVFHGNFYTEEEMMTLFDALSGDPLELCVKIAAYYGLRRSEVLGLRWDHLA